MSIGNKPNNDDEINTCQTAEKKNDDYRTWTCAGVKPISFQDLPINHSGKSSDTIFQAKMFDGYRTRTCEGTSP